MDEVKCMESIASLELIPPAHTKQSFSFWMLASQVRLLFDLGLPFDYMLSDYKS